MGKFKNLNFLVKYLKYIILGSLVGIFTGVLCALLLKSLEIATNYREKYEWLLFLLPIGGAVISLLYVKVGKNSSKGNNLIIEEINSELENEKDFNKQIPFRMAPLVFIGTFTTHLFGGSAGREGSGVQIGGAVAAKISKLFKLNMAERKILLMSGVSCGFGAIFGTPLAGVVFGMEVSTIGSISYEALIPCFFASFIGSETVEILGVTHSHYEVLRTIDINFINTLKVILIASIFGLVSKSFSELTHLLKRNFSRIFKNAMVKTFVIGIVIIILTYIIGTRKYLGLSLPLLSETFKSPVLFFDFLLKLIFTSVTLGGGFQGGEVTPLFVIGGTLGNFLAQILSMPISYGAAIGLVGVFAGATNAPLASFILGVEMFGGNGIQYMFLTCIISYFFSGHRGIYGSQIIGVNKYWKKDKGRVLV